MSIFQRKLITGNTFVDEDTSGIFEYQFAPTLEGGYESANSITEIHLYSEHCGVDFQHKAAHITEICTDLGFATLTTAEKDIVGIYGATSDDNMIIHYATVYTAGNIIAALDMHADKMGDFVVELQSVATIRINGKYPKVAAMKYFKDRAQIDLFMSALRNFISDYTFKFHLGTQYGDSTDGILDYIENTGGYNTAGTGLDSYDFSDIHKQVWYDANAVDPANPTQPEQDTAHTYVKDLLKNTLVNIIRDGLNG